MATIYDGGFTAKGHGYDNPTGFGLTPCTAFDGWRVISRPLGEFSAADRDSRVWKRADGPGVTYASHAIALAVPDKGEGLAILMQHGGGREVLALGRGPDTEAMQAALLAMDERTLYAVLYSIYRTAESARKNAADETRTAWALAHHEKRIRKRKSGGRISYTIESADEKERRTARLGR